MAKVTGEGSIIQLEKDKPKSKCRKWQLRVPIGMDPRTGKYKTRTRRFQGTFTEAKKALREFIAEIEDDHAQGHTDYTFESYCKHYLEMRGARGELSPASQRALDFQLRVACRYLRRMKLEKITTAMLDEMYVAMRNGDTPSGKPASGTYVRHIHKACNLLFKTAIQEGVLTENPCERASPPADDTVERKALGPAAVHALIAELDPHNARECAFLLAVTTGLRRGEICGLSWGDVDFENRVLNIRHSLDQTGRLKKTKTRAGIRILPLSDVTYEALVIAKQAQKEEFEKINQRRGPREKIYVQDDDTAVITGWYGNRVHAVTLSEWWIEDRAKYGLDGFKLHELRHTYLSLLAEEGVHPKIMQELAGHASSSITMDIYTHINLDAKREAVKAVQQVF